MPAEQLREVAKERDDLKKAAADAEEAAQVKRGEWEGVAQKRETERDEWKGKFFTVGRRAAFVAAIATQVPDATAAYKLAVADGLLKDVKVDDEGEADSKQIAEAVKTTMDRYKSIFGKSRSFGGERGAQGAPQSDDPNTPISPRERLRRHHEANPG